MKLSAFKLLLIAVLSLLLAAAISGQSPGTVTEFDPGFGLAVDVSKQVRLDFYTGREKSEEISSSKFKVGGGVSVRLKPVFKRFLDSFDTDKQHLLVLAMIYEYSRASDQGETKIEHKLMADATLRYNLPRDFLLSNRNRFENRWINDAYHWRYRNRPVLERPFEIKKRDITPYIAAEAFWDQRYSKWNMFKFTTGVQVPIYRRASLELFYERQHCVTCADPNTNIFGVNLNIAFKRKK